MARLPEVARILLTGADGQVGTALRKMAPADTNVLALNRSALDITDERAVHAVVEGFQPGWIINAAAYTAVDEAESEPDTAYAINRDCVGNLAAAARIVGARMMHLSTDYVFDGRQSHPYAPGDLPEPLNVYGKSKLEGENSAQEILNDRLCIIRTSWVYASAGRNFLTTMTRLLSEREKLGIIEDQVGTPTCANGLARVIYAAVDANLVGIYHWSDAGVASWYDFALTIQEQLADVDSSLAKCRIYPIKTVDYHAAARRPSYSVLDRSLIQEELGVTAESWRYNVHRAIHERE